MGTIAMPAPTTDTNTAGFNLKLRGDAHIQDATYTLVYKDGSYFTFKVETVTKGALIGKRIISFLSGPDNTTDFTGFAFLNADGTVALWKRFRNGGMVKKAGHLTTLFTMPDRLEQAGMDYATRSGRCRRCGRTLTVPASLNRGFGSECAKIVGVA